MCIRDSTFGALQNIDLVKGLNEFINEFDSSKNNIVFTIGSNPVNSSIYSNQIKDKLINANFVVSLDLFKNSAQKVDLLKNYDCLIITLTPTSFDEAGYKKGYEEGMRLISKLVRNISFKKSLLISSTRVYIDSEEPINELSNFRPESFVVIGYPKKEGDSIFNCAGVLRSNSIITEYKKQELPNYEVFDEKRYFQPGDSPGIFEVNGFRVGHSVCEDIWHQKVITQLHDKGADLVLNINASPFHLNKIQERKNLISGHASKFSMPIVYANQIGGQDELVFDGTSMAMDSKGKQVLQLAKFEEDQAVVSFLSQHDGNILSDKNEVIPEDSELEEVYKALVLGAKDYINKNKFPGVLIGSSGGIDSALTAVIAADAIGSENVRSFMMPFKFTSDMSVEDANKLADCLLYTSPSPRDRTRSRMPSSA